MMPCGPCSHLIFCRSRSAFRILQAPFCPISPHLHMKRFGIRVTVLSVIAKRISHPGPVRVFTYCQFLFPCLTVLSVPCRYFCDNHLTARQTTSARLLFGNARSSIPKIKKINMLITVNIGKTEFSGIIRCGFHISFLSVREWFMISSEPRFIIKPLPEI